MFYAVNRSLDLLRQAGYNTDGFIDAYWEAQRCYHGISHMEYMVQSIEDQAKLYDFSEEDYVNLVLATWYHDMVYVVGAPDNEEMSAMLARSDLGEHSPVPSMVLMTKFHKQPETFLQACLIDADLAGLGGTWETYELNRQKIREEYRVATEAQWNAARGAFLEGFLERKVIYHTSWGCPYERFARRNMERELEQLQGVK